MDYTILRLTERPDRKDQAARWFHANWNVPLDAYLELEGERIIAGLGVIENDFHNRRDLAPNVCAVYTEPDQRGRGIAGALLRFACADMKRQGIDTLYLITDHQHFYERYGWEFLCMVQGEGQPEMTRMYIHREP